MRRIQSNAAVSASRAAANVAVSASRAAANVAVSASRAVASVAVSASRAAANVAVSASRAVASVATLAVLATAGALFAGCGTARQSGICGDVNPSPSGSGDVAALEKAADEAWAQRGDRAQAELAIKSWQDLLAAAPNRHDIRTKLARANYYYADSILWLDFNIDQKEAVGAVMAKHYKEGANQAEMALGQRYPGFRSKYCARQPFNTALEQLDKDAVPAMYWYAASLSRYALMTSLVEVLNQTDRIKAMMDLIGRLDPAFWYWASDRYQGGFYTKIPFPSGDFPRSTRHFEKALGNAPDYLATKVIFAEMNAAKAGDKALFERLLKEVIAFDLETAPDIKPENAAEQKKAKYFLDDINNLVEEPE
jgi:hypothetical protein